MSDSDKSMSLLSVGTLEAVATFCERMKGIGVKMEDVAGNTAHLRAGTEQVLSEEETWIRCPACSKQIIVKRTDVRAVCPDGCAVFSTPYGDQVHEREDETPPADFSKADPHTRPINPALDFAFNSHQKFRNITNGEFKNGVWVSNDAGEKHDTDKLRYDLLPYDALDEIAGVLTYGADKYDDRRWEKGLKWGRLLAGVFRHLSLWAMGERLDKESGLPHLAHAGSGILFLIAYELRGVGTDDRFKPEGDDGDA